MPRTVCGICYLICQKGLCRHNDLKGLAIGPLSGIGQVSPGSSQGLLRNRRARQMSWKSRCDEPSWGSSDVIIACKDEGRHHKPRSSSFINKPEKAVTSLVVQYRGPGFIPGLERSPMPWGNWAHAPQLLSPQSRARANPTEKPACHN